MAVQTQSWVAAGDTYPAKDRLKAIGGKWNKEEECWEFSQCPTDAIDGIVFVPSPLPEGWWVFDCIDSQIPTGTIFLRPLSRKGSDDRADYAICLGQWTDKTFDEDRERWVNCVCTLTRPLTGEEWARFKADRNAAAAAAFAKKTAIDVLESVVRSAPKVPSEKIAVPQDCPRFEFGRRSQPHFAVLGKTEIFLGYYNGASGDNWAPNNWGDYVVWVAERTPEVEAAFFAAQAFKHR